MRVRQGSSIAAGGLEVDCHSFAVPSSNPPHRHRYALLTLVLSGVVIDRSAREEHVLTAGEMLVQPAGTVHTEEIAGTPASVLIIEFGRGAPPPLFRLQSLIGRTVKLTASELENVRTMIHDELPRRDEVTSLMMNGVVFQLVATALRRAPDGNHDEDRPRWLEALTDLIDRNIDQNLCANELAGLAGVCPAALIAVFRAWEGVTVTEYIRRKRMEGASRALTHSNRSMRDIAMDFGFCDQGHFARAFKARYGVAPTTHRRNCSSVVE